MPLPKGVFRITRGRRVYYYHQPNRHKPKAERGMLTRIPYEPSHPEFWDMAGELNGAVAASSAGTFKTMIAAYKASPQWASLTDGSRETYTVYLTRIEDAWGSLQVADLTVRGISALRDEIGASTPSAANMMVKVLRAFLKWVMGRGEITINHAIAVDPLKTVVRSSTPWPEEVWESVCKSAPTAVSRLAFLGRKTGQRISDLVRMKPDNLKGNNLHFKIKKRRMKDHVFALHPEDAAIVRSWDAPWFSRDSGEPHTEDSLRDALDDWLGEDGEEIKPHGLRALAVCDARRDGITHQKIALLFGMSISMVQRYSSLIDVELANRETQDERAKNKAEAEN